MLTIRIKDNSKEINIENLTESMLKEITKTISGDITSNIENERIVSDDIGGNYLKAPAIDPKYRAWKIKNGMSGKIFRKEENMINEVTFRKNGKLSYRIFMKGVSEKYASYVNDKRKFFGISDKIIKQIEDKFKKLKLNA